MKKPDLKLNSVISFLIHFLLQKNHDMKSRILLSLFLSLLLSGCQEFITIDPPRTDLVRETTFQNDQTAIAAMTDIYYQLHNQGFASGDLRGLSLLTSLSADELINAITWDIAYQQINENLITPENTLVLSIWSDLYHTIYKANAIIEGVSQSKTVSPDVRTSLIAEAKFIRAFSHFYLVNLFGDTPLVLTTNYKVNQNIPRTATEEVYNQIILDLIEAREDLVVDFSHSNGERTKPNKTTATALLARIYLYRQDWEEAIRQASIVIEHPSYQLTEIVDVFKKNNKEAIWQLLPRWGNTFDAETFLFYGFTISNDLSNAFEPEDNRINNWMFFGNIFKYQAYENDYSEYSVVMRLAEQYLIRAEAEAQLDQYESALADLNIIRNRAGLPDISLQTKEDILLAIEKERQTELFGEWGHRWFDLKRTSRVNDVMKLLKNGWKPTAALLPIPEAEILNNPAMRNAQNPGY